MTLFVNGSKRTELSLFGKISLITDNVVEKLFNMDIERKGFVVDNLKFEVIETSYIVDNKLSFIVSEV